MAKGQKRSNKEIRKPKAAKSSASDPTPTLLSRGKSTPIVGPNAAKKKS